MIYNVGSNLFNVLGNYLLIFGKLGLPKLGVAGAAISTSVSRFFSVCGWFVCSIFLKWSAISIRLKGSYRINFDIAREIFSIGLPSAMEQFVVQGGLMMLPVRFQAWYRNICRSSDRAQYLRTYFFTQHGFWCCRHNSGGQSLGANDEERAKRYADIIHHMAIAVACFMGLMFILFSYPLACLYTEDLKLPQWPVLCLK